MKRIFGKVGYFLLGGIVATIGYIAGSMDNSVAQQDIGYFRQLHVKESILVGDITSQEQTFIGISSNDKTAAITLVHNRPKDAPIQKSDATATIIASESTAQQAYSMLSLTDKSNHENKLYSYDKPPNSSVETTVVRSPSQTGSIIVEVMARHTGVVAKKVMLVSADVKMSNGKRIHVKFTNPQTTGMFGIYDNIRIRQKGSKWEFIEHIPK